MSTNRSLCSTSRIACCSWALRARGCRRWRCGIGAGRSGGGLLQLALLGLKAGDLLGPRVTALAAARHRQPGQRARITRLAPLHDMAGVQALAAQQRPLRPLRGGVVLGQDLQLVLGRERPPLRLLGHLGIAMFRSSVIHPPRVYDPGRPKQCGHLASHSGNLSIPALGSLIVSGRLPQMRLAEKGNRVGTVGQLRLSSKLLRTDCPDWLGWRVNQSHHCCAFGPRGRRRGLWFAEPPLSGG